MLNNLYFSPVFAKEASDFDSIMGIKDFYFATAKSSLPFWLQNRQCVPARKSAHVPEFVCSVPTV
jgi:hypothetical protein